MIDTAWLVAMFGVMLLFAPFIQRARQLRVSLAISHTPSRSLPPPIPPQARMRRVPREPLVSVSDFLHLPEWGAFYQVLQEISNCAQRFEVRMWLFPRKTWLLQDGYQFVHEMPSLAEEALFRLYGFSPAHRLVFWTRDIFPAQHECLRPREVLHRLHIRLQAMEECLRRQPALTSEECEQQYLEHQAFVRNVERVRGIYRYLVAALPVNPEDDSPIDDENRLQAARYERALQLLEACPENPPPQAFKVLHSLLAPPSDQASA